MDRIWISALTSLGAACGNVSNQPADARAADAPPDMSQQAACDPSKPFGPPVEVTSVDTIYNEWTVVPSGDGLSIFLGTDRPGGGNNVYIATRATAHGPFDAAAALPQLNTVNGNTFPSSISKDGLSLYLYSDRGGTPDIYGIYIATRPSLAADFGAPARVANVNDATGNAEAFISADGHTLYFSSGRSGGGDLYRSTLGSNGQFGTPTAIGELNTAGVEDTPVVTSDELTIFFTRDNDIWTAHRTSVADGFGTPTKMTDFDTPTIDRPAALSADGCVLYLVSNGRSGTGGIDVYIATRPL